MDAGNAKPVRAEKVEHVKIADKDLQKQFEMLSKVKPKPMPGPVTKISYGNISSMNLRGEWIKKSSKSVPGVYRLQEWQKKDSDLTLTLFTKLPKLTPADEKEAKQVLSKPDHQLSPEELKFVEKFSKLDGNSAKSRDIYHKRIVLLKGKEKNSSKRILEVLIFENKQPGLVVHQITLRGEGEQFEKYQPLFEDSLHTIDWGVSAGDLR